MTIRLPAWFPGWLRRVALIDAPDAAAWRNRQLLRSIATSFFSKGVSSILQLVAMPIAIRALGADTYGIYAMLVGALAWVTMSSVGIGPGLTLRLASGRDSPDEQRRLVTTATVLMALMAGLALAVIAVVVNTVGIPNLFGERALAYEREVRQGLVAISLLLALYLVSTVIDAAQAGYQNQYVSNLWTIAANILTIGLLVLVVPRWASVVTLILAIYGPMVLARVGNCASLLLSRPYLLPRWNAVDPGVATGLIATGGAIFLGQLASYGYHQYGAFWVGRVVGPDDAARYAVMSQVFVFSIGLITMITVPLWPAIADAYARRDGAWIWSAYRQTRRAVVAFGLALGLGIAIAGEPVIARWISPDVAPTLSFQLLAGCFFVLDVWDNLHYSVLLGLNRPWLAAATFGSSTAILLVASAILVPMFGLAGMAGAQCLGRILVMSWLLPHFVSRELRRLGG